MRPSSMIPRKQLILSLEMEEPALPLPTPSREELVQAVADLLLEALGTPMEKLARTPEAGDEF
ncbi:hypothetical protein [Candidatus Burkholderia verschuerenii]|uniref:hypothetical protein n=1 Tax=Candidatus Burkholderia verschuerenii TaxID=242163 RepID=UPI0012ED3673|nr:hypothetical protein [Candidatus Burkholderia verschuerenii]